MTTSPSSAAASGRPSDLWTGLALLLIAAAMAGGALQFPLRGTYAGVKNAWYVSAALFPLIVATCLFLLAVTLIVTTVRANGLAVGSSLSSVLAGPSILAEQGDVVLIAGIIVAFVVGLVPRVDFIVAGFFFLAAFTLAFHVHEPRVAKLALATFFVTALVLFVVAVLGLTPVVRTGAAFAVDAVVLLVAALAVVAARCMATTAAARHRLNQCLAVALITPLLLGVVFKFLLLVPLPREGFVVVGLETVYYAIRGAL